MIKIPTPCRLALAVCALLILAACEQKQPIDFKIVSGSENTVLEPIVQAYCRDHGLNCSFDYKGSLDIGADLTPGASSDADAVWPAASLWVDLFDTGRKVKKLKSVSQSPVILGVRLSKAKELGWIDKPVTTRDIVEAVKDGKLKFLMTSATQSNSGASAYLAMLAVLVGQPDVIEPGDLDDPKLQDDIKLLLSGVERSSGSSGWLKDLFMAGRPGPEFAEYDAMWNYESVLKETNDALAQKSGAEKLWAVYPADGVFVSDSPLGFIDRGRGPDVEKAFDDLQAYLESPEAQQKIAALGRRVALSGTTAKAEPDWNFDPARLVNSVRTPAPDVIQKALALYQDTLRRPSLTAFCLDYSGSMQGDGEHQVHDAMHFLLTPSEAGRALVQWTPRDKMSVFIFNETVQDARAGDGTLGSQSSLLDFVDSKRADGGTDMYACIRQAAEWIDKQPDRTSYLPAILVMTDGKSDVDSSFEQQWRANGETIPIFGITFGDADKSQLDQLADLSRARVFDGRKDLQAAFRAARGYN